MASDDETSINSLEDAFRASGFSRLWPRPDAVIGEKFKLVFCTTNADEADPTEVDRHELISTISGIHWDESLNELVITTPLLTCGIGTIKTISCNYHAEEWLIDLLGDEAEICSDPKPVFCLIPSS